MGGAGDGGEVEVEVEAEAEAELVVSGCENKVVHTYIVHRYHVPGMELRPHAYIYIYMYGERSGIDFERAR